MKLANINTPDLCGIDKFKLDICDQQRFFVVGKWLYNGYNQIKIHSMIYLSSLHKLFLKIYDHCNVQLMIHIQIYNCSNSSNCIFFSIDYLYL